MPRRGTGVSLERFFNLSARLADEMNRTDDAGDDSQQHHHAPPWPDVSAGQSCFRVSVGESAKLF
jgi:hypothetical protein